MPSGLFLRIFLWFWLAMTVVGVTFVLAVQLTRPEPGFPGWHEFAGNTVSLHVQRSVEVLKSGGRTALRDYLDEVESDTGMRAAVCDSQGQPMVGRMPPNAQDLTTRSRQSGRVEYQPAGRGLLVARSAATAEGEIYTLVGRFPRFALRTQTDLSDVLLRLLAVAMTGGIVCYGLALYLTSPVGRLQKVTRQLAQGDLKTRAGVRLRKRGDEFADLAEDFDRMAERIESLITSQKVLLSDISHELRSPLARLGVALELARKRAPQEAQTSLDRIELEAARMNELIGQVLKLTELENRGQPEGLQLVSLTQLVEEVVADANYEAARQNRAVRMIDSTDCVVRGAPDLLRSAIENVVRNALRYTVDDTEVEVAVRSRRGDGRSYAQVVVGDHGPGVPETELHEIFRPFHRVGDARDRQSGGSGLGLAIAERVVRIHGGAVRASNVSSGGLRVQLDLPVEA